VNDPVKKVEEEPGTTQPRTDESDRDSEDLSEEENDDDDDRALQALSYAAGTAQGAGQSGMGDGLGGGSAEETEETKASHKMAERRRRQRMSGLFETLRDMLPNHGSQVKISKGWVLLKGERVGFILLDLTKINFLFIFEPKMV